MSNKNLLKALFECKKEVPEIAKNLVARVRTKSGAEYTYKYADLADVQRAIKLPLEKHGLMITHEITSHETKELLITKLFHVETGEFSLSELVLPEGQMQERGASITFGKRYNICALLDLSLDEDIDGPPKKETEKKTEDNNKFHQDPRAVITEPQRKGLFALSKKHGWDEVRIKNFIKARFGIESTKDLTKFNYDFLINVIEKSQVTDDKTQGRDFKNTGGVPPKGPGPGHI